MWKKQSNPCCAHNHCGVRGSDCRHINSRPWIYTDSISNAIKQNHFKDVLEVCGPRLGLLRDTELPSYDPETDLVLRLRKLSNELKLALMKWTVDVFGKEHVDVLKATDVPGNFMDNDKGVDRKIKETKAALKRGRQAIVFATLGDRKERMVASCPLLVRSDCVEDLFSGVKVSETGHIDARPNPWYVLVSVRHRRQSVNDDGTMSIGQVVCAKVYLNNVLLGKMQGHQPKESLMIFLKRPAGGVEEDWRMQNGKGGARDGRGGIARATGRGRRRRRGRRRGRRRQRGNSWRRETPFCRSGSFKSLPENSSLRNLIVGLMSWKEQRTTAMIGEEAYKWRRRVASDIDSWLESTPDPYDDPLISLAACTNDSRLRPNMKVDMLSDWPWRNAKRQIALRINEVTLISSVSFPVAKALTEQGFNDFKNKDCTVDKFDGGATAFLRRVLTCSKPSYGGIKVWGPKVPERFRKWHEETLSENARGMSVRWTKSDAELGGVKGWRECGQSASPFFVDFEQFLPEKMYGQFDCITETKIEERRKSYDKQAMIAVIGCGRVVNGVWQFCSFIARGHAVQDEYEILCEWLKSMSKVSITSKPRVIYWGSELNALRDAVGRIEKHCKIRLLVEIETCDLHRLLDKGGFYAQGMLNLSLKEVSRCLESLDVLGGENGSGREDVGSGTDATALLLSAFEQGGDVRKCRQVGRLLKYNEADCRDMARIWECLMSRKLQAPDEAK